LRTLLASILEGYSLRDTDGLLHRNTAVSLVRYEGGQFHAEYLACDEHLRLAA
jgi:hypothetical protein